MVVLKLIHHYYQMASSCAFLLNMSGFALNKFGKGSHVKVGEMANPSQGQGKYIPRYCVPVGHNDLMRGILP